MADLPVLVLSSIFDFLSIPEKLKVRSACKTWKYVIDTFSTPQSVCIYSVFRPYNKTWCFSNQRIAKKEMLRLNFNRDAVRRLEMNAAFFQNLQKVYLSETGDTDCFLLEVSQLPRLKVLMLEEYTIAPATLSSSSLEKLFIECYEFGGIELDTPNLNSFALQGANCRDRPDCPVVFRFPLRVKHLECPQFTSNLSGLKNLETLVCEEIKFNF